MNNTTDIQPLTISCVALYHEQEHSESMNKDKAPATKILPTMHLGSTNYCNGGMEDFPSFTKGRLGGKHCLPRSTLLRGLNQEAQRWECKKGRFTRFVNRVSAGNIALSSNDLILGCTGRLGCFPRFVFGPGLACLLPSLGSFLGLFVLVCCTQISPY
jgi:hypothetical protein